MILQEKEGVAWLEFEQLKEFPHLVHGVFLRQKGVHTEEGMSFGGGIEMAHGHRSKVRECLKISSLVSSWQRHEDHIFEVDKIPEEEEVMLPFESADGLFTKKPQVGLTVYHADCQAVLFYDPKREVIANIHCGWRGSVKNILGKTVMVLKAKAFCDPKDLRVCISPSLGPKHAQFIHYQSELPETFYSYQVAPAYFDFWEISYQQLCSAGVRPEHIEMARLCTYADEQNFFSYRRDKTRGRNVTVIGFQAF